MQDQWEAPPRSAPQTGQPLPSHRPSRPGRQSAPGLAGRAAARSAPMLGHPSRRRRRRRGRGVCSSGVCCPGRLARRGGWRAGGSARARGSSASTPRRPGARRRALRPGSHHGRGVAVERAAATTAPGRGGAAEASWRDAPRDRHPSRAPPPLRPGRDGELGWAPPPGRLREPPALAGVGSRGRAATRGRGAEAAGRAAAVAGAAGAPIGRAAAAAGAAGTAIGRTAAGPGQGAPAATGGATGPGGGPAAGAGAAETGRPASTPATAAAGAGTDTVDEGTRPSSSPAPARWTR